MSNQTTAALDLAVTFPAILPYAEALRDLEAMRDALPPAGTMLRRDAKAMLVRQAMNRAVEYASEALSEAIEREIPTYDGARDD